MDERSEFQLMRNFVENFLKNSLINGILTYLLVISISSMYVFWSFQGYTHPREYIVTEWPLPTTCSDIWSLVYDHDCSAVVVLCNPTSTVSNVSTSVDVSLTPRSKGEKDGKKAL